MNSDSAKPTGQPRHETGMSYKFQRLRERIRQSLASGELSGKLPGERELARRFHVNAKTLSKALTDLAAEGVLHRSVGRGTFVKGSEDQNGAVTGPWLILADDDADQTLLQSLRDMNPEAEVCPNVRSIRPSYLNQFAAVIDLAVATPETFIRDLLVRGIPVVTVGQEARTYSTNSVILDATLGVSQLTRQLVLGGHRTFAAIEGRTRIAVAETIRQTASRYCSDFSADACFPADVVTAVEYGATACVCDSISSAIQTIQNLTQAGITIPEKMSVCAVGSTGNEFPCSGYFVDPKQQAEAVADILRQSQPSRPTILWLAGTIVDRGTIAPLNPRAVLPAETVLAGTALRQ